MAFVISEVRFPPVDEVMVEIALVGDDRENLSGRLSRRTGNTYEKQNCMSCCNPADLLSLNPASPMVDPVHILEMKNIRKTFPGVVALDGVHLELRKGEVHILLGENGAGKSTLMKILSGAYQKTTGELLFEGRALDIKSPKHSQDLGVSTIYQELNLVPNLSAAENIYLGREPCLVAGVIDRAKMNTDAQKLLDDLGVRIKSTARVIELSIAQQQMVEVAKALSTDAKILIMDEPTSALTEQEISQLFNTIRRLKNRGVSIIYISHRFDELFEIGDRVTVLRDGKYVDTRNIADVQNAELIRMMVDRDLTEQYPKKVTRLGDEALRVENLSVNRKLDNINFSVRKGEILGISGLLGSGRTELARAIFGLDQPSAGGISVRGRSCRVRSPRDAIKLGIGFVTEDRKSEGLVLILSVKDNIMLPSVDRLSRFGVVNSHEENHSARRFVDELRIKTPNLQQNVLFLSGGNQQKVVLSKWLCCQADIFIFDEPTRGIDVGSKVEIYQLMNELTEKGVAIILISSELPELLGMSDRILVMHQGRVAGEFSAKDASQEKLLKCALGERHEN